MHARFFSALSIVARRWKAADRIFIGCRQLSTDSSQALRTRIPNLYSRIMDAEWVDEECDTDVMFEKADAAVAEFRDLYNTSEKEGLKELYEEARKLYLAKEAARLSDAYGDLFTKLMRKHMDQTGILGNETLTATAEDEAILVQALREYIAFVKSMKDKDVAKKIREQVGPKALLLRQTISAENFSSTVAPVAGDHLHF